MTFRFGDFELDEARRELRLNGRELEVQPLVFDLIAYLLHHRDRVVTKEELLAQLWDDALVVDGALQRVVSLARSALKKGGAQKAIRTYARRGYRFCEDATQATDGGRADVERARAAYDRRDWETAVDSFAAADRNRELDGPDLERWACAAQSAGRINEAVAPFERAIAAHAVAKDSRAVARVALNLSYLMMEQRKLAVAKGWHRRAARSLSDVDVCEEHAMFEWLAGRISMFENDADAAMQHFERTIEMARAVDSTDYEAVGLVYSGHTLIATGDIEKGVARHNEAAAAVLAGEVGPWCGGLVYCSVIWGCRNLGDWKHAAEWTEQFLRWCETHTVSKFPGTCQLHHAEVLSIRGDLDAAQSEIDGAVDMLSVNAPWAEGDAHRLRGELFLLRGRLEEAERDFRLAHEQGWDPQPGYAMLHLARGETDAAMRSLERSLADRSWSNQERRALLLAHMVVVATVAGDPDRARQAMAELDDNPGLWANPAQSAAVDRARAELHAAEGRKTEALDSLRAARKKWEDVNSPWNVASTRLRTAELFLETGDRDAAELEKSAAVSIAGKLGLSPLLENAKRLDSQAHRRGRNR